MRAPQREQTLCQHSIDLEHARTFAGQKRTKKNGFSVICEWAGTSRRLFIGLVSEITICPFRRRALPGSAVVGWRASSRAANEVQVWAAIGCLENTKTHRTRTHSRVYYLGTYVHAAHADPMKHSVRLVPSWQQLFQHQSLGPCRLRGWKSGVCLREVEGREVDVVLGMAIRTTHRPQNAPLSVFWSCFGGRSELGLFQTACPFVGLAPARLLSILCPPFVAARSRRDSPSTVFITPRPVTTPAPLDSEASKTSRKLLRGGIPFVPSVQNTANNLEFCPKPSFLCWIVPAAAR